MLEGALTGFQIQCLKLDNISCQLNWMQSLADMFFYSDKCPYKIFLLYYKTCTVIIILFCTQMFLLFILV